MCKVGKFSIILIIALATRPLCATQKARYFKAEHGVAATYVMLASDGRYEVVDREHMGVSIADEGHWQQVGQIISFSPKNPKNHSYEATEVRHKGYVFLAITSDAAAAGIVIAADDIKNDLDADPRHLPDHVLFRITARTYRFETKQTYPFRYIGK